MAMYGLSWPCFGRFMVLDGLLGPFYCRLCVYGLLWENIDLIELVSFFLAVIDPNSFGLVINCYYHIWFDLNVRQSKNR